MWRRLGERSGRSRGRPGLSGHEERARAAVSSGGPTGATQFLHVQLRGTERGPLPSRVSPWHWSLVLCPHILASHSLSPWLSQAPKRSAQGQLGGRCTVGSETVGGLSLGRRDLTRPGSAHPAPGRNTVQQEQAPTMLGSDPAGTLAAGSEPLAPGPRPGGPPLLASMPC